MPVGSGQCRCDDSLMRRTWGLVTAIGIVGLLWVVLVAAPPWFVHDRSLEGLKAQNEVRTTLLQGLGGIVLLVGAYQDSVRSGHVVVPVDVGSGARDACRWGRRRPNRRAGPAARQAAATRSGRRGPFSAVAAAPA
jgi:hypothetical protein